MKIAKWAVTKPISVLMVIAMILLLGAVSLVKLPMDLLPKMNIPIAVINTQYVGAGPYEIENLVTKPIEEAVAAVHNVKNIHSNSMEGTSIVTVELNQGTDMDLATLEIREKIDLIKGYLPEDATQPIVLKIDPNALPIMVFSVTGDHLEKLQEVVEYRIKPRLERLEGVASVGVTGGRQKVVTIKVDPMQLTMQGITQQQLGALIRGENINLPGGEIIEDTKSLTVRTVAEFQTIEEIKALPIPLPIGTTMKLEDLAEVTFQEEKITQIAKINGIPSIRIALQKQPTFNTIQVTNMLHEEVKKLQDELENIELVTVTDQSLFIRRSISNVAKTAAFGGLLAVLILYLFMKSLKNTLVIALSIPISIIATFTLMYFTGLTLNLLSLGGFALGIGMLVDNGIVVLENIYRFREEGYSAVEASIHGAQEVAMAVAASTLTTIAVFLPIVFVEGMTGEIFKELALTVTFSLLASLGVSLTLVPMLASKIVKSKPSSSYKIFDRIEEMFQKVNAFYSNLLKWSLSYRRLILSITIFIFLISMISIAWVGAEYFPEFDEGTFMIHITLPEGSSLKESEAMANKVEKILETYEDIEIIFTSIGGGDSYFGYQSRKTNRVSIDVRLKSFRERQEKTLYIIDKVRKDLGQIAGANITVSNLSFVGMGFGDEAVEVEIQGDSIEILREISQDFIEMIKKVEGTREVTSNFTEGRPQLELYINREIAVPYGLQTLQIANTIRNFVHGMIVTRFRVNGEEHDVVIQGKDYLREGTGNFMQLPVQTMTGEVLPLEHVTSYSISQGPNAIRRSNQVRSITIKAAIMDRDLNSIIRDIESQLKGYPLAAGYSYQFRGQKEALEEAYSSLALAVILAVLLVYMVLAIQFQSLLHPLIIMLSVPLAFSGGALGLLLRGIPLSVPAIIGVIVLSGIVVNNGIVLIDYINILRENKKETEEAILIAGTTRLRPIMMTTLTTILGLLPLALGVSEGSEVQMPLATTVIGGLVLSTPLTLIVLPVIYAILDDLGIGKFHHRQG
ncbi:efflux RND transporter permease subunit [Clostridium formicaceticum]|uniref:Multidrug ABC transporter n=1 Tax=Clostridium formicaceticum TaxID=1497 RepID=A0AAC9RJN5_9CLOT|nr:efflux RND transporter permease subunit [Clostridium formicaceticum]AOY76335.1 multidrug ABC transporter [Clostridium formicaceticum]ARE86725.1 Multidrug resistance protein MdtC [Clostridium formicaceticum]